MLNFTIPTGHAGCINAIDISADGNYLVSASRDNNAILWDVNTSRELRNFTHKEREVMSVYLMPDGKRLITGSRKEVRSYSFSSSLTYYYITGWDIITGRQLFEYAMPHLWPLCFSPDGETYLMATGSPDSSLEVRSTTSGQLKKYPGEIQIVTYAPDGKNFYTAGTDKYDKKGWAATFSFKKWKTAPDGIELIKESQPIKAAFSALAVSPDNRHIATATRDYALQLWDGASWKIRLTIPGPYRDIRKLLFSADNQKLFVRYEDYVSVFDVQSGALLYKIDNDKEEINVIRLTPDKKFVVAAGMPFGEIKFYNLADGSVGKSLKSHATPIYTVEFSMDEKYVILNGSCAFELATGKFYGKLPRFVQRSFYGGGSQQESANKKFKVKTSFRSTSYNIGDTDNSIYDAHAFLYMYASKSSMALMAIDSTDWLVLDGKGNFDGSEGALRKCYFVNGLQATLDYATLTQHAKHVPGLFTMLVQGKAIGNTTKKVIPPTKPPCCKILIEPIAKDDPTPELKARIIKSKSGTLPKVSIYLNGHLIVKDAREVFLQNTRDWLRDSMDIRLPVKLYDQYKLVMWGDSNFFDIRVYNGEDEHFCNKAEASFWPVKINNPELFVPAGHTSPITSITTSHDGKYVFTGGSDGQIIMWDKQAGRPIRMFNKTDGLVTMIQISENDKFLFSQTYANTNIGLSETIYTRLYDIATGEQIDMPITASNVTRFSGNGKYLMNASSGQFFDLETKDIVSVPAPNKAFFAEVTREGRFVILFDKDHTTDKGVLSIYDLFAKKQLQQLTIPAPYLTDIFLSQDEQRLLSLTPENRYGTEFSFSVFSLSPLRQIAKFSAPTKNELLYFGFSLDGNEIHCVKRNGEMGSWNISDGKYTLLSGKMDKSLTAGLLNRKENWLLRGYQNGIAEMVTADSSLVLARFRGLKYTPTDYKIAPDNSSILVMQKNNNTAKLFRFIPGEELILLKNERGLDNIAYSPKGNYIITLEEKGDARLWNSSGRLIRTFSECEGGILRAEFTNDNKQVFLMTGKKIGGRFQAMTVDIETGEVDPEPRNEVWFDLFSGNNMNHQLRLSTSDNGITITSGLNSAEEQKLAELILLDNVNWILYTDDGYYAASKQAVQQIYFTRSNHAYPFGQFDLQFNRPDKIMERLKVYKPETIEYYYNAYEKRLQKMGFQPGNFERTLSFNVPQVHILGQQAKTIVTQRRYSLIVDAMDSLYKLDRLQLFVNGVPEYGDKGYDLKAKNSKQLSIPIQFELSAGINKIRISVFNEKAVESIVEEFIVEYNGVPVKPELYIVSIGVSKYKDPRLNLGYAAKDARDVVTVMGDMKERYAQIHSYLLTDVQAEKNEILKIKQKLLNSHPDDHVVVFYAGHGMYSTKFKYYLATHSTNIAEPATASLMFTDLVSLLENIPARNRILLVDACHSGENDKDAITLLRRQNSEQGKVVFRSSGDQKFFVKKSSNKPDPFDLMKKSFVDLRNNAGINILCSTNGVQVAVEGAEWKNGVFTYCLIYGLTKNKADLNNDGSIYLTELKEYLSDQVSEITKGGQTPDFRMVIDSENILIK